MSKSASVRSHLASTLRFFLRDVIGTSLRHHDYVIVETRQRSTWKHMVIPNFGITSPIVMMHHITLRKRKEKVSWFNVENMHHSNQRYPKKSITFNSTLYVSTLFSTTQDLEPKPCKDHFHQISLRAQLIIFRSCFYVKGFHHLDRL